MCMLRRVRGAFTRGAGGGDGWRRRDDREVADFEGANLFRSLRQCWTVARILQQCCSFQATSSKPFSRGSSRGTNPPPPPKHPYPYTHTPLKYGTCLCAGVPGSDREMGAALPQERGVPHYPADLLLAVLRGHPRQVGGGA